MSTSPNFPNGGEQLGVPPGLQKRRGLLSALLHVPEQQAEAPDGLESLPLEPENDPGFTGGGAMQEAKRQGNSRLISVMNGAPTTNDGGTAAPPTDNRIEDDRTRHPQGDLIDNADSMVNSSRNALVQQMQKGQGQPTDAAAPDDHLSKLQGEYDELGKPRKPLSLLAKIALGLSTPFGGLSSYVQAKQSSERNVQGQRNNLLSQIEAERRMQEQETLADKRLTLQQQMEQDRFNQQNELERQKERYGADRDDRRDKSRAELDATSRQASEDRQNRLFQHMDESQQRTFGQQNRLLDKREENKKADRKPTADEQRRADLSENLNENLSRLEDIVNRRPELFGPAAGRLTGLRSMIGTSDQDIAALDTIKHQIGMAQISAHGMRSAHGIDAAAESILNGFHNKPEAILAALNAARTSVKTFADDVERKGGDAGPTQATPRNTAAQGAPTTSAKTATQQHISDYAAAKGISTKQALQEFKAAGYTVK